jgi:sarcosine oxidase subunit beta
MKVVIIGGGVQGLLCAYELVKHGIDTITILEAQRIGYGESSRCGGGIRTQFRNEMNILLAKRSMKLFEKMTSELNYQILLHHGGYLYLHYDDNSVFEAEREVKLHNKLGVQSRLISPQEVEKVVPGINTTGILVGQYNPQDASCHHDALLWAVYNVLINKGITIKQKIKVNRLEDRNNRVVGVWVDDGFVPADVVIIAAGAWTRLILDTVDINVPTAPWRREQLISESIRHLIKPFVMDKKRGISFHQTSRGEIIGNANIQVQNSTMDWNATRPLIEKFCNGLYDLFPAMCHISIMRQWAGSRDFSPDGTPIFGPMVSIQGLWAICGQSGTGWMLAPAIAEAIALGIVGKNPNLDWEIYSSNRFSTSKELWERSPNG